MLLTVAAGAGNESDGFHCFENLSSETMRNADSMAVRVARWALVLEQADNDSVVQSGADRFALMAVRAGDAEAFAASEAAEKAFNIADGGHDRIYAALLRSFLSAGTPDSMRCRYLLESTLKNMPGTPAADIAFTLPDGSKSSLAAQRGKKVVLFFYDPDCDVCHNLAAQLGENTGFNSLTEAGKLVVVAIAPDSLDADSSFLPSTWMSGKDNGSVSKDELYDIPNYPCVYLIDENGNVLLKNTTAKKLVETLI